MPFHIKQWKSDVQNFFAFVNQSPPFTNTFLPLWQCFAWYCLACIGGNAILQFINRGEMRRKYGIDGSGFGDFCGACCCTCCQLIQENKESIVRTTGMNPKTKQPYQSPGGMSYP